MSARKNIALEKTVAEITDVRRQLEGKRIPYDPKKRLVMADPIIISGLWPQCERLTFQAFTQIRGKRDWDKVKNLCVRTPKTVILHDLLKRRFAPKKKAKA